MYHEFYELKENPFSVTADPDFFFSSKCHSEAMSILRYGILHRKGFLLVTGEIGTGKTMLCRKILRQADAHTKYALILNPTFSESDLLQMIIHDLGMSTRWQNNFRMMQNLNRFLIKESSRGNNVAVIIDEAQNLSVSQLEQLRLLSNLETEKEKLLQIVLVGQPELDKKLSLPELRQLRQRIAIHYRLQPLERSDIQFYLYERVKKASKDSESAKRIHFSDRAVDLIYQFTNGMPRAINILCDRVLLAGFVRETFSIDETLIENCAKEVLYCEHNL